MRLFLLLLLFLGGGCTAGQLGGVLGPGKTVDPRFGVLDERLAELEKDPKETLSWQEWVFIATGVGGSALGVNVHRNRTRKKVLKT